MTWEWVALISLLVVTSACVYLIDKHMKPQGIIQIQERLAQLEIDNELVKRLADETQKLLSQNNLQKSLRPR